MNEAGSSFSNDGGGGGRLSWNQTQRNGGDGMMHESNEPPAQQQHPYPTQQQQQQATPTPNHHHHIQSNDSNYSNDPDANPIHQSLTPFRPMQPREFSLGGNLRRVHPAMPMLTLPADVSGMRAAAQSAKATKSQSQRGATSASRPAPKLGDILGSLSSSSTSDNMQLPSTRRSSLYSRRSSAPSEMGRISEEESNSRSSSGMSSAFSETLTRNVGDDQGEIVGDHVDVIATAMVDDEDVESVSQGELIQELLAVHDEKEDYSSDAHDDDYEGLPLARSSEGQQQQQSTPTKFTDNEQEQQEEAQSMCSEDDDDSAGSFLSWDASRRSADYIIHHAMEEWDDTPSGQQQQQQKQQRQEQEHANSHHMQQQQQQFVAQTNNPYESHPSHHQQQQQQAHSADQYHQTPQTQTNNVNQSYNRKVSQESCDSMVTSDRSPTPFRPMLPRELLLGNNLRRTNHAMPFPVLPADATSGSAARIAEMLAANKDIM